MIEDLSRDYHNGAELLGYSIIIGNDKKMTCCICGAECENVLCRVHKRFSDIYSGKRLAKEVKQYHNWKKENKT
jgi:hypothetical protein